MKVVAALLSAGLLAACTTMEPAPRSCLAGKPAIETQLYFGLSTTHGVVSAREWQRFVEREITPRFAEGFTIVDARGFWLSAQAKRTISENSKLLIRVHNGSAADNDDSSAIVEAYKRAFAQESVLRIDENICAKF